MLSSASVFDPTPSRKFNQEVVVDGSYTWMDRMYQLPIRNQESYSNQQMVQAPDINS